MNRLKRLAALLLACVLLVGAMPVPALATDAETCQHVYETAVTDPICGQGGYTTYLCTLCGDAYEADYSDPLGGCTLEPIAQVDANCTSEGTAAHYQCRVCKNLYHDEEDMIPVEDPVELVLPIINTAAAASCIWTRPVPRKSPMPQPWWCLLAAASRKR